MENIYLNILDTLQKKINLLIIDDDEQYLDTMETMFSSPLLNVTKVLSQKHAIQEANKSNHHWHCWILDVAIGKDQDGLHILKSNRHFPFTIVFSGLKSMTIASRAMQIGAINVFDKGPGYIQLFFDEVCKTAALGFVLNGKQTKYFSQFLLLKKLHLQNYEQWANEACISIRQLERICSIQTNLTPKYVIPLYYSIYYLLRINNGNNMDVIEKELYLSNLFFLNTHLDKYKRITA